MFAPESVHCPLPLFVTEVAPLLLSMMLPLITPTPAVEPCSVSVFAPTPVAVKLDVKVRVPVPESSSVAPPVVPARSITRLVLSPMPVYVNVAPVVVLPIAIVP